MRRRSSDRTLVVVVVLVVAVVALVWLKGDLLMHWLLALHGHR